MFENLIESKPKKIRTGKQFVMSGIMHVLLVLGAISATKGAAETIKDILADTTLIWLKPPEPPPPPPPEAPPPDAIVTANPPPLGFQTVMPPTEIPKEIPPVNLNERFNAADFTGKGVEGGIAAGVAGGTGPVTGEAFLPSRWTIRSRWSTFPDIPACCSTGGYQGPSRRSTWWIRWAMPNPPVGG